MSTQETRLENDKKQGKKHQDVEATVDYLPATKDYEHEYAPQTVLETIRADAKNFFAVQDRQERDKYFYYLVHDGTRIQNTQITLEQLIGQHAHKARFSLVEEITAGGV